MIPKPNNSMRTILLAVAGALWILTAVHAIASTALPATPKMSQAAKPQSKTFSGTILKNGDNFVLSDTASKISYVLDDAEKASQFEGKKVKVTGTVDVASNTIHVESIQEIA